MAPGRRTRILIVDDSAVMRSLLRSVVGADPGLVVAGAAADGESALSTLEDLRPDLVLLDVEMPVMDGLVTLKKLRARGHRMPVIMCSSLTQRGARVTIEALAGGASDYVTKPAGQASVSAALQTLSQELIPKIHALAAAAQVRPALHAAPLPALLPPLAPPPRPQPVSSVPAVLVIGVSTGGPAALDVLLPALPAGFPLPVLIVQHMPEGFTRAFAERLNGMCPFEVKEAAQGDLVVPNRVLIAPGNYHMGLARQGSHFVAPINVGPKVQRQRPAADVLFQSVAQIAPTLSIGVILTGMGADGAAGLLAMKKAGARTIAQDEASCVVFGMPKEAIALGAADLILPVEQIADAVMRMV